MASRIKLKLPPKLPPSVAAAPRSSYAKPRGAAAAPYSNLPSVPIRQTEAGNWVPVRADVPSGLPREVDGVPKPKAPDLGSVPARPTTNRLDYWKGKAKNILDYDPRDQKKITESVEKEETKVNTGNADYFAKLGEMKAKEDAYKEEMKSFKAQAKAAGARRLAGL